MYRAVFLQIGATVLTAVLAGWWIGERGVVSAALGGAACILPNLFFAFRLTVAAKKPDASYPAAFFVGEFVKVASTIALLAAVMILYRDVHWISLFVGMIVALKANLFALLYKS